MPGVLQRYGAFLDLPAGMEPVSIGEGSTPLLECPRLAEWCAPGSRLFVKFEGMNPTGSFKDRGMTVAVSVAKHQGAKTLLCASTGNTAASAAAYAARAGLGCTVVIPGGAVAMGKLAGAVAYGARVVQIDGSFDDALRMSIEAGDQPGIALVNSVNPARLEGQKTGAWEISEELGRAPDLFCLPVGNAGNITSYWMGFSSPPKTTGDKAARPRLLGVQAAGAAPLVHGAPVDHPETKCTAIRIGRPARGDQAIAAIAESGGAIRAQSDEEIFAAYRQIAALEGIFCEPSSAAGIAGLRAAVQEGWTDPKGQTIVAILTGHGLKDPNSILDGGVQLTTIPAQTEHLLEAMQR